MAQSGPGKIRLFDDFCGPEIPVAVEVAHTAAAGYYIGPFALKGDLADDDAGVVALGVPSGAVRLTSTNEAEMGTILCTDLIFSVPLNGPLICEARVQTQVVTARNIFVGFCGTLANAVAPPCTSDTVTHTLTATDLAGFHIDTSLTATDAWHCVYNGGTDAGQTVSTSTTTGVSAAAGEWDVVRTEIYPDGTVEYWLNGNREFRVENAATVTSTDMLAVVCGSWGTASTISDLDVDYLLVEANRDWTR